MPTSRHVERHFTGGERIRDIVLGMSDGLTVPFALAAGLSGAATSAAIVVTAGCAEIAAGSIAMGLGGFLAARSDAEHYSSERKREMREIREKPEAEVAEVADIFRGYGLREPEVDAIVGTLAKQPDAWADFMMRFELGLEKPEPNRALSSALTIAGAYVVGGLVPLVPFMALAHPTDALPWSCGLTLAALFGFGFVKGRFTGTKKWKSAMQTTLIGGLAAGAAFAIARAIA